MNPVHHDRLARLKQSAAALVEEHSKFRVNGKYASDRTRQHAHDFAHATCERLWRLKLELRDIANLDERHVRALVEDWYASGLGNKTMQNHLSRLRLLCRWIGKPRLVPSGGGVAQFLPDVDPKVFKVSAIAQKSKSWTENGVDVEAKIRQADGFDARFGAMLRLGWAFGLRRKEQLRLVPTKADAVRYLLIRDNVAKSGKDREIPMVHQNSRETSPFRGRR